MDAEKDPVEKEHLYGSVYLIKSGRKRLGSSVQNIPKTSNQNTSRGPNYKLPEPSKGISSKINKNDRSNYNSNTQPISKLTQDKDRTHKL